MAYHIGRKYNVGIGKETSRGTAVAADYWLPKMDFSHDDKIDVVVDESSIGIIEDAQSQDVVGKHSEGTITGRIADTSFGLWLLATLGTEAAPSLVATGVYDHVFTVAQTAVHTSLTVSVTGPNESTGLRYVLSMVDNMEVSFEVGKYAEYKATFRGNANASASNTASFSAENIFLPQNATIKIASTAAGISGASAIALRKATFKISKNIEDDQNMGSISATDRINKQFACEGSLELVYADRSYIDTIMIGDLAKALSISFANTAVTIGSASNPTITFLFYKVKLTEVARTLTNNDLVKQTVNFKAFYSISDSAMMNATLRNTKSSSY